MKFSFAFLSRDFIKSLATFNKPIVAGVQGAAVGLGVTMLSLFDLVIASDKASFCTPYGKLGQIAEGAAVFTLSHILGSAVVSIKRFRAKSGDNRKIMYDSIGERTSFEWKNFNGERGFKSGSRYSSFMA